MKIAGHSIPEIRKSIVAFIGLAVLLVNQVLVTFADYISTDVGAVISGVVAFVTLVSVYLVRNGEVIDDLSDGKIDGKYEPLA
jgi:hypothetical protein